MKGMRMGCVRGVGQRLPENHDWPCDDHGMEEKRSLACALEGIYPFSQSLLVKLLPPSIRGPTN